MEISVIIPTYKPSYYIWECLKSLAIQSLDKKKYEVLIILNGEKENYYSNIKSWIEKHKVENFKILYTKISGVSNARNMGLDNSNGKYIVFIDDDDYVDKNYLEELLKKNNEIGEIGIVITNYINFEEKTRKELLKTNQKLGEIEENICKKRKVFSTVWMKSIPKNIIGNIRFNTKFKNGEDSLFMVEISRNISKIGTVDKEVIYHRRVRRNSANFKKKKIKEIFSNTLKLEKEHLKLFFRKKYNRKFIIIRMLAIVKGSLYQLKNIRGRTWFIF